ncbi:MAG: endonuclease III [Methanomicrobiales archaeon]|jgi:endonuclease-3|nr:endonuclease III [Methanomicrobiales archaeon]
MNSSSAEEIFRILQSTYPLAEMRDEFLHFQTPFQSLIATILSAQTTDISVNAVTPELFSRYPIATDLAHAKQEDVEAIIRRTGFYRSKAKNIIATAQMLTLEFSGEVPADMEQLQRLPGVGRKTANIVMSQAFSQNEGIAVDTHVKRISMRLGLTSHSNPDSIEQDLCTVFRREWWEEINALFILHGRRVCNAQRPKCEICVLSSYCVYMSR